MLSIETESEQKLIERFIQQLQAGDGDFWIGLRRSPQRNQAGTTSQGCPSQYYWLDGSKAKFRSLPLSLFSNITQYVLYVQYGHSTVKKKANVSGKKLTVVIIGLKYSLCGSDGMCTVLLQEVKLYR